MIEETVSVTAGWVADQVVPVQYWKNDRSGRISAVDSADSKGFRLGTCFMCEWHTGDFDTRCGRGEKVQVGV